MNAANLSDPGVTRTTHYLGAGNAASHAGRLAIHRTQVNRGRRNDRDHTRHPSARRPVDAEGNFEAQYDYDNPAYEGDTDDVLLEDDQQKFPRDQEHLPDWHPSKLQPEASR